MSEETYNNLLRKTTVNESQEPVKWKPAIDEIFFIVGGTGEVFRMNWHGDTVDEKRWNSGNCFQTEDEAIDSYIWLGFKLQQSEYDYWIPGVSMPKPEECPKGCEFCTEYNWVETDSMPRDWAARVHRWPKQ